ncbi:serine/threonine-protein kinase pim-1-like isoform X3, partial [Silurus meridionalis]
ETHSLPVEVALLEMVSKAPHCRNVVELLEWFDAPDYFIMILERPIPCMNLYQFCKHNNFCLSELVAREIFWQVVQAACHCCERGVLHRDIKPENILINPETLVVKLIDFGCGDLLKNELYTSYSGTPGYWPPEWVLYKQYYGIPATVWSLGLLLCFLVCGNFPFNNNDEIVEGYLQLLPDLSDKCRDLITCCLEKDARHRPTFKNIQDHEWFLDTV